MTVSAASEIATIAERIHAAREWIETRQACALARGSSTCDHARWSDLAKARIVAEKRFRGLVGEISIVAPGDAWGAAVALAEDGQVLLDALLAAGEKRAQNHPWGLPA